MTVQQAQSKQNLAALTFAGLIEVLIHDSHNRQRIVDEIARRWAANRTLRQRVEEVDAFPKDEAAQRPSQPIPEPEEFWQTAQTILRSEWDYSGLRNQADAPGLLRSILQDKMTETDMTDQTLRYFKSIRSNFRQWQRSQGGN